MRPENQDNMQTVREFPHAVREMHHVWVRGADGTRLAARIWLPQSAEREPVPAILEYIPYRKRDLRTYEDSVTHPYLAGHGYAAVRVDLRGSGDSEGVLSDEYTPQELADGVAVIEWIARQPWCDGRIGMLGISWGGFNALQIAALQPPSLKTIITVCSTDDRYADDVHYMGGCMLLDNLSWAGVMFAYNACPPDPECVGEAWRVAWLERLRGSGLWLEEWTRHQRRDDYWKHGSVAEEYSAIRCPVFAVGGWADGYCNAVFRLLRHLRVPRKGLVGPWSHRYPHLGKAGPAIGFLQESLRWWDYWLKGKPTGVMDEPMLRAWMQDSVPPAHRYRTRQGRWVVEDRWPSARIRSQRLAFVAGGMVAPGTQHAASELDIRSPLRTGLMAGKWCSYAAGPDMPGDQREDDAGSLVFDSAPLEQALEILGAPHVELEIAVDRPLAMVAVRLGDLHPDGRVCRVSYGLLNLAHRDGHQSPQPLEPGRRYRVRISLKHIAQRFPAGHRVRLALSTSYWPLAWPPPELVRMRLYTAGSSLSLPVREPRPEDARLPDLPGPAGSPLVETTAVVPGNYDWRIERDLETDTSTLEVNDSDGIYRIEATGTEVEMTGQERYSARNDDPLSVHGEIRRTAGFRRGEWHAHSRMWILMRADARDFHISARLEAREHERLIFENDWCLRVPRDHI